MLQPKLRFPGFEGEWLKNSLSKICEISSGGTPSRLEPDYWHGTIPWVTTTLIDFNNITYTDEFITEKGLKNSSAKLFPTGTILMAMYGQGKTRGKVAILGINATTNQACGAIIPNSSIVNNFFLFYNLSKRYDEIRDLSNQGGQENLSAGIIKNLEINFPSLPEQTKIASFLSTVDEKIQHLKKQLSLQEQYKKGVMQKIFSREIRFKDENGNDFPEWEEKKLGEIGFTFNGLSGKTKEDFGKGMPYIQYKQIFDNSSIDISKCDFVEINDSDKQQRVKFGDVFFTVSSETPNEIGTASVLLENVDEMYLNSFCFGFRPNSINLTSPYFLRYLFRSSKFRSKIIKLAQGSTRYNMSKLGLLKLSEYFPAIQEQQKIASFLSSIDDKIEKNKEQIRKMELWKKGLLQQMFV
jgi:type I restriction enzyme S subunit